MSDRLLVSTRKGLFTLERKGGLWSIAQVDFLADNVTLALRDPRDGWRRHLSRQGATCRDLPRSVAPLRCRQCGWRQRWVI